MNRTRLSLAATTLVAPLLIAMGTTPAAHADPASQSPPKRDRVKVLTAVLNNMHKNYAKFAKVTPGPQDIFNYKIGDLWKKGIDGAGTTVALIEGWDDPGIKAVVHNFDKQWGLPDPQIQTIFPSDHGKLPAKCPPGMVALGSYGSCDAWVGELELDVVSAHLMAPYAKILISATPADSEITDDQASQVAPPEMMHALEYISSHHLANAMSISDGTGEVTYPNTQEIRAQDPGELTAAAQGVPVFVSTGDCGVVQNLAVANAQCGAVSKGPDTATWDDSPWITAMGGTIPNVDPANGNKLGPDPVWHSGIFSPGAGFSKVYKRPAYQNGVASITKSDMRSVPDITMDSRHGTSESAPMFAGVMALASQLNHGDLGPINTVLYDILGKHPAGSGIADVVSGNNSAPSVPGFTAAPGFDVVSGWGTIDASKFVPSLVAAVRAVGQNRGTRLQAAAELQRLEHNIKLSGMGKSRSLSSGGFLPGHPVMLSVDHHKVTTLKASATGTVSHVINLASLHLKRGWHVITLNSMLVTVTGAFFVK